MAEGGPPQASLDETKPVFGTHLTEGGPPQASLDETKPVFGTHLTEGEPPQASLDEAKPVCDTHLLDCPICLEKLHQPKSLPCLHSFCLDCLSTFISKDLSGKMAAATSFPCPVCRQITHPVNHSEGKEKWAQQFPTSDLINSLMKVTMDEPKFCKPCEKKGKAGTLASVWCQRDKVLYCETCKEEYHDLIHDDCETVNISKDGYLHRKETKTVRCGKHGKKMDYYCDDHHVLGCSRCIIIDHRRCNVVTTTQEYCDKLKRESRLDQWKTSLKKTADATELLIKEFGEKLQTLTEDQDNGFKSLTDLRQSVDARLDTMQKNITDELIAIYKKEKGNLDISRHNCEWLTCSIQNTIKSSETAIQRNDNVDTILLYQRGLAELKSYKDLITEMRRSFTTVRIRHSFDPDLLNLNKNVALTLGEVTVQRESRNLPDQLYTPLSESRVKQIGRFSIKSSSDDSDCLAKGLVYLPSGHIIVGDFNNKKIKLFGEEGKLEDELKVPESPYDMCRVDDQTVAVSLYSAIYVIRMMSSKFTLLSNIRPSLGKDFRGITYTDGKFFMSCAKSVYSVSWDGNAELIHTYPAKCYNLACIPWTHETYVSQFTSSVGGIAVSKLSGGTRTDIAKVGVMKSTFGMDIDHDGNLYVCGRTSKNVVQMSADGNHVRELLTLSDGMDEPRAISVCGDKFVVTDQASQHRNEIRLFQFC